MAAINKHLITELAATGIASPVLLVALLVLHAGKVLGLLTIVVLPLGQVLGDWLNRLFPPDDGVWFAPVGNVFLADGILVSILTWILLMTAVKLFQRFVLKRRQA